MPLERADRAPSASTAIALVVLAETARRARTHGVGPEEEALFRLINSGSDRIRIPAWIVMQSGSLAASLVAGTVLARQGRREQAVAASIGGTLVWASVKIVKPLVGRGRPGAHLAGVTVRGQAQSGLGYPSGHAAVAFTLAAVISCGASPFRRWSTLVIAWATGAARMYVGAHLPLDVAGGISIGTISGQAARRIIRLAMR